LPAPSETLPAIVEPTPPVLPPGAPTVPPTEAPTPNATEAATAEPTATPEVTPRPTPITTPSPVVYPATGPWAPAGSSAVGGISPNAVLLADGRVLVLDPDGDAAELYDPTSGTWRTTAGLPAPRIDFAMVALADGRVLLTGGTSDLSLTSSYLFDPRREIWLRTGSLGTPRSWPAAVLLRDGRVLVLGGYDTRQRESLWGAVETGAVLAGYRPDTPPGPSSTISPPANNGPAYVIPAIATAELFDPATGRWSPTGPMHYARYAAPAVTLTDGRVLVVGSRDQDGFSDGGEVYAGTSDGAELYDPATRRFAVTDSLPFHHADRTPMYERWGVGSLVALDDGDALLVGATRPGWGSDYGIEGKRISLTRSFGYDVASGRWSEVGTPYVVSMPDYEMTLPQTVERAGDGAPADAVVAKLAGGRVLAAGGQVTQCGTVSHSAELYFPATGSWTPLPPVPEARAGGAAIALPDGTALLIGGYRTSAEHCWEAVPLTSAVRFVPGR
jgi:hypothetical protein